MHAFKQQQLYIDGRRVDASSGETFETINPANGDVLAEVQRASKRDVDHAVASAQQGQRVLRTIRGWCLWEPRCYGSAGLDSMQAVNSPQAAGRA